MGVLLSLSAIANGNTVKNSIEYLINDDGKSVSAYFVFRSGGGGLGPQGHVDIPSFVIIDGKEYVVESILNDAFRSCQDMTSITIPSTITSIGSNAFEDCIGLTEITIPESVKSIDDGVFNGCSNLLSINLPEHLDIIGNNAFEGCSNLKHINIPNSVQIIGIEAFKDCSALSSMELPESLVYIASSAFEGCTSFNSIKTNKAPSPIRIGQINEYYTCFDAVTTMGVMCRITSHDSKEMSICGMMYCNNSNLELPDHVRFSYDDDEYRVNSIDSVAFANCKDLTVIFFYSVFDTIGDDIFKNCNSLAGVYVPKGAKNQFVKMFRQAKIDNIDIWETELGNYNPSNELLAPEYINTVIEETDVFPKNPAVTKDEVVVEEPIMLKEQKKNDDDKIYTSVHQMPQFPGGEAKLMKIINKELKYPKHSAELKIEGKVIVQFVVKKDGCIGDVKIVRSVDRDLDQEAIRIVKSLPKFEPGRNEAGEPVNVWLTLPITFKLNN